MDNDPTRIPVLLEELRQTWEAQPHVSFAELLMGLSAQGITMTSSDSDVTAALRHIRGSRHAQLPADWRDRRFLLRFVDNPRLLSLVNSAAVTWMQPTSRRASRRSRHPHITSDIPRPSIWEIVELGRAEVSMPLRATDSNDIRQRLGVIESIEEFPSPGCTPMGARRESIEDRCWCIDLEDDTRLLLGRSLLVFRREARAVTRTEYNWERIERCEPGRPFEVRLTRGETVQLDTVRRSIQLSGNARDTS